jgi:hypothetical protein
MPQRANGRLRVAAILEAAADVIAEKGYEAATMAEIDARDGSHNLRNELRFGPCHSFDQSMSRSRPRLDR